VGLAAAAKMDGREHRTFVLMGDGETQEGSVWEAAMAAGHYGLSNLVGIVDKNRLQIDGQTEEVMTLEPYRSKWEAFGWEVEEIDGHHTDEIIETFKRIPFRKGRPSMVIANTIKGRGLSFMENNAEWHGKAISGEYAELAQKEVLDTHESRAL
jgi:transketolase